MGIKKILAAVALWFVLTVPAFADPKVGDPMPPIQDFTTVGSEAGHCGLVPGVLTVYGFNDPNKTVLTVVMDDKKVAEIVAYEDESEYTAYIDDTDSGKISRIVVEDKDTGDICADLYPAN